MQTMRLHPDEVQHGDRVIGFMHRPVAQIVLTGFHWRLADDAGAPIVRLPLGARVLVAREDKRA